MTSKRKKSKVKIPKRIAGVKVPKAVRKGRFGELLASRTGQAMIAQAILGAGAAAAAVKAKGQTRRAASDAVHSAVDVGENATQQAAKAGSTLAYALGEAARTFAQALQQGEPRSFAKDDPDLAWTPDYGAPERASGRGTRAETGAAR